MLTIITEIWHNGIVVCLCNDADEEIRYWLPAPEWGYESKPEWHEFDQNETWEKARDRIELGAEIDVVLLPEWESHIGLPVVSARRFTPDHVDDSWWNSHRDVRIMDISRNFIKGLVGNISVIIPRQEYNDFLENLGRDDLRDHGALASGDFLRSFVLGRAEEDMFSHSGIPAHLRVDEKWLRLSFQDSVDLIEMEVNAQFLRPAGESGSTFSSGTGEGEPPPALGEEASPATLSEEQLAILSPLLLVEDNDVCRIAWAEQLRQNGIDVIEASDSVGGAECLATQRSEFKMAIIDVHLGMEKEHDGIELAEHLRTEAQACHVVLTSGEDVCLRKRRDFGHVEVHGYLIKPCLSSDLVAELEAAAALDSPRPLCEWLAQEDEQMGFESHPSVSERPQEMTLAEALAELFKARNGFVIHVFRVHPRSWRGRSLGHLGEGLNWVQFRSKLGKSVIKDAASQNNPVIDNDVSQGDSRHLWTQNMMNYGSFWGKQLQTLGPYRHVLVAFHPEREVFDAVCCLKALVCAERVTRVIERKQLLQRAEHDAECIVAGLGFGCLAHEIYDDLTGLEGLAQIINGSLGGTGAPEEEALAKARKMAGFIARNLPKVVSTARILRGLGGGVEPVSVEYCLTKAIQTAHRAIRDTLENYRDIRIENLEYSEEDVCFVRVVPSALVIVFFNVLLNAAQQIALMRCVRSRGRIWATVERYEDEYGNPWAVVWIHDTGPGIHPEDWESIFEPGHTTKQNGTGLGLHICRQLLKNIKGAGRSAMIEVTRSLIWAGTTFAIRLPLTNKGEAHNADTTE